MSSSSHSSGSNLESWRNVTSIGLGSSWGSGGFNYDDRSNYPPGLSSSSHQQPSKSRIDQRHADIQAAFLRPSRQPSRLAGMAVATGTATPSAETSISSRRSSTATTAWQSAGPITPATEYDWRLQQKDENALKGDAKEFIPSDSPPHTAQQYYDGLADFGGGSMPWYGWSGDGWYWGDDGVLYGCTWEWAYYMNMMAFQMAWLNMMPEGVLDWTQWMDSSVMV